VLDYGVAHYDGSASFLPPSVPAHVSYRMEGQKSADGDAVEGTVHRLETIAKMLGHRRVDIVKLDVEGAEYGVIEDLRQTDLEIGQLLVEFHHRHPEIGAQRTRHAIELLNEQGFLIFNVSDSGEEYSFLSNRSWSRADRR
jgi:hypothetical protein